MLIVGDRAGPSDLCTLGASDCYRREFGPCFGMVESVELLFLPGSNCSLVIIRGLFYGGQGIRLLVTNCLEGVLLLFASRMLQFGKLGIERYSRRGQKML